MTFRHASSGASVWLHVRTITFIAEPCLICHPQVLEFVAFRRRLQQSHSLALAQAEQAHSAALQVAASPKDPVRRQALKTALASAPSLQVQYGLWASEEIQTGTRSLWRQLSPHLAACR